MTHLTRPRPSAPRTDTSLPVSSPIVTAEYPKHEETEAFAVFDALTDIVCVTTADGTMRYLNRAGRDLLGYVDTDDALIGALFPAHTPDARRLLLDEVLPTAVHLGQTTCDTALQTADGRVFPARQTVIVTPESPTRPASLTIVIRDVSIERHAAARLGESQRLFEMITRAAPDLMYLYDPEDERIVWMNRCPHAFLGGSERDARTLDRNEKHRLVHRDDRAQFRASASRMSAAYSDSDVLCSEVRMRTTGGNWRWVSTRASVFSRRETGAPLLILGIARDITARKKNELRLVAERDAADQISRTRGEFVSRMTREFRSALHAIIGLATEVRLDRDRRLTAREHGHLADVVSEGMRLLETVSDLHDFSAIESGDLPVEQLRVDVRDLLRQTVESFADHPALERIDIELAMPDDAAPVLTDPVRLREALTHVIANALAFTLDGWISVSLRVEGEQRTPVAIDVEDSGIGIEPERQSLLFTPFHPSARKSNSSIHPVAGTGLGLACARALCEMIGCALTLPYSAPGTGSTFRITLPVPSRSALLAGAFPVPLANPDAGHADPGSTVISLV